MEEKEKSIKVKNQVSREEKTWGMIVHLSALVQFVFHFFGLILGPLVVWLIKRDNMPFVREQGIEALNFNISVTLYAFIIGVGSSFMPFWFHRSFEHMTPTHMSFDGTWMTVLSAMYITCMVGLFIGLFLFWLINVIRAAISANKGVRFHYPLAIHFLKDEDKG